MKLLRKVGIVAVAAAISFTGVSVATGQSAFASSYVSESAPASAQPLLHIYMSGPAVASLQHDLGGIKADGYFGPNTQAAVVAYQRAHHLQVDGVVGPQTWGSLFGGKPSGSPPPTSSVPNIVYGAYNSDVAQLQSYLGGIVVDGDFGSKTEARLKAFQASVGLPQTGTVDAKTWQAVVAKGPGASTDGLGIDSGAISGAKQYGWAVDANKQTRMLYLLRYDKARNKVLVALSSPTSFGGCNSDGCYVTPDGAFHVYRKAGPNEVSHEYNDSSGRPAAMPWAVYLRYGNNGMAIHYDPLGNSHECVHVPVMWKAEYINHMIPVNAIVVIHG